MSWSETSLLTVSAKIAHAGNIKLQVMHLPTLPAEGPIAYGDSTSTDLNNPVASYPAG